jgi:ribosomal protein L37AE/L43A
MNLPYLTDNPKLCPKCGWKGIARRAAVRRCSHCGFEWLAVTTSGGGGTDITGTRASLSPRAEGRKGWI